MNVILKISGRNLARQKRRNLLLGIGIALGISILVVANSFSHGLSDILLNRLLALISGHVKVTMTERDDTRNARQWNIIRDKERLMGVIEERIQGEKDVFEVVTGQGRALANDKACNISLIGADPNAAFFAQIQLSAGKLEDIRNPAVEYPILVPWTAAKTLKVKAMDTINIELETVYGQSQSARFTVVGIIREDIPFFENDAYVDLAVLKPLLAYKPHETGALKIILRDLKNPAFAIEQADRLHRALQPNVAGYAGAVLREGREKEVRLFAVDADAEVRRRFADGIRIESGTMEDAFEAKDSIVLSRAAADELGAKVGDRVGSRYQTRFEGTSPARQYRVCAIFQARNDVTDDMAFLNAREFYDTFFPVQPKHQAALDRNGRLYPLLLKEWNLLERSLDEKGLQVKYDALEDANWRGAALDVQTMFELAGMTLKLELGMNGVALIVVGILFVIILVGMVNTLRMTIRERTREIGTVRAIGMRANDVRASFVLEVALLTVLSNCAGIALAFVLMRILTLIPFDAYGMMKIFLVDQRLYFIPTLGNCLRNFLLITSITFAAALLPSGKAARISVAEALRHYE